MFCSLPALFFVIHFIKLQLYLSVSLYPYFFLRPAFFFPLSAQSFHLYVSFKASASSCLSVVRCLLPARVQGALGSPRCQYHPELRHKGLSLLLPSPLLGPLVHSLPLSVPFPPHPYPSSSPAESHPSETMLKQGHPLVHT